MVHYEHGLFARIFLKLFRKDIIILFQYQRTLSQGWTKSCKGKSNICIAFAKPVSTISDSFLPNSPFY